MVFAVSHVQTEAFQHQAGTEGEGCAVTAFFVFASADFHLRCAQGVIACCQVELVAQQEVGTQHDVLADAVFLVVQACQRSREAQGRTG